MSHPYETLPQKSFWRSGVVQADKSSFPGLFEPKFALTSETSVATAGSCFAQHIGRFLCEAGCNVLTAEKPPRAMLLAEAQRYGYGIFSGRYGNIYTTRQMLQLLDDAATGTVDPRFIWEKEGRFYDAFRPTIEPEGYDSVQEVLVNRSYHLERTAMMLRETDTFIFTLGLTETFLDRESGRAFPMCPGVVAGTFDEEAHRFLNMRYNDIHADLVKIRARLKTFNPDIKMLLTVSPVPLTATAAGEHVLTATTWSKSTLRAAAGEFAHDHEDVDYFPSYEIIMSPASGGPWFEENLRSVRPDGVERVMGIFFESQGILEPSANNETQKSNDTSSNEGEAENDLICDELLLQAFSD